MNESFLIVKTSAIGDVIQTFPVLDYLRTRFPSAQIHWALEEGIAPLLRAHPQLDRVIPIRSQVWRKTPFSRPTRTELGIFVQQLRSQRYDLLFDLQGNAKSALVTACARADVKVGFGWKSVRERLNLLATHRHIDVASHLDVRSKYLALVQQHFNDEAAFTARGVCLNLSPEEESRLSQVLAGLVSETKLMVCFGSKWPNKQLAVSLLGALLKRIAQEDAPTFVLIYGNAEEKRTAEALADCALGKALLVGELSLPLWQALMGEMDGVIAVDSAALHLCGTTDTPTLSVFGPSLATVYKPPGDTHLAIQGVCPYKRTFSIRCPILRTCSTGACIKQLEVEELFSAYRQWSRRWVAS